MNKVETDIDTYTGKAAEEISAILSVQSVIVQTSNKLVVYEEKLDRDIINSSVISGMITAISLFLDKLQSPEPRGFEIMGKEGVYVTIHRTPVSYFILISSKAIPKMIQEQMIKVQDAIEKEFSDHFDPTNRGVQKLTRFHVRKLYKDAGFKLFLSRPLKVNETKMELLKRDPTINPAYKNMVLEFPELARSGYATKLIFSYENIVKYFQEREQNIDDIARAVLLACRFDILILAELW